MGQHRPPNPGKERSRKLTEYIRDELREAGKLTEAEEASGRHRGYFRLKLKENRDPDLLISEMLVYADVMGTTPSRLLQDAGISPVGDQPGLDGDDDLPRFLADIPEPKKIPWLLRHLESGDGRPTSREELLGIDDLRYKDPGIAHDRLMELAPSKDLWPLALAVAASCHRLCDLHSEAAKLLSEAWLWSEPDDFRSRGDIYQRATYILENKGFYRHAVAASVLASSMHLMNDDRAKIGETIVDRARCFWIAGNFRKAETAYRIAATRYIDQLTPRNQFAAIQGLGMSLLRQGRTMEAKSAARRLNTELTDNPSFSGKCHWFFGSIAFAESKPEIGVVHFRAALEHLKPYPIDALICASELAANLSQQQDKEGIRQLLLYGQTIQQRLRTPLQLNRGALAQSFEKGAEQEAQMRKQSYAQALIRA